MTERKPATTSTTMINYLVDTALRLAPRYANEDSELMFNILTCEFPTVRQDAIRLIVSRLALVARAHLFPTESGKFNALAASLRHEVTDLINNYELTGDNFPRL